jgi:Tol biopolymer transport system component/imidazolonepropionase-like amidohydrolase
MIAGIPSLSAMRRALLWTLTVLLTVASATAQERVLVDVEMTEGTNMAAALSPDGETLILAIQGTLWSVPATGGTATQITPAEMDAQEPVWNPDGESIAFYGFVADAFSVWTVAPDGSDLERLPDGGGDSRYPSYSNNGSTLYYASDENGGYSLWSTNLDSGVRTKLTTAEETGYVMPGTAYFSGNGNAVYPALSPDGNLLAYVIDGPENILMVRSLTPGTQAREVYRAPLLGAPLWSADGMDLYLVGIGDDTSYLASVRADGSGMTRLVDGGDVFPFRPSQAPDGTLYYTADGAVKTVSPTGVAGPSVAFSATVTLDRTPYERRTYDFTDQTPRDALGIVDPVLSPDGSQAAFTALGDLWMADLEAGTPPRNITDDVYIDMSPSWSPDGTQIAFVSDREGKADIWLLDIASGEQRRITDVPKPANSPVWSPDGTKLAYLADSGNSIFISATVNVLDLATGADIIVADTIFGPSVPSWSPDGSKVVVYYREPMNSRFREGKNVLYVLPADGQGEKLMISPVEGKSLGRRQHNRPAWASTGEIVYRIDGALWSAPMSSEGELGDSTLIAAAGENPSWSADGSKLIFIDGQDMHLYDKASGETTQLDIKPQWTQALPEAAFTIRAGRMYDGVSDMWVPGVDIVVQNGVITEVRQAGLSQPVGTLIDASEQFVMPGLIENHTHQSITQGIMLGNMYLCHAITSLRETGDDPYHAVERRESEASGRRPGPRVFTAGPLNEGTRVSYGVSETVEDLVRIEDSSRLSTELQLNMYKSYVRQDYAVQKRAIELAHEAGIPVSSHELYPAVANGADQMEHLSATSRRGFSMKASRLDRSYQDVIALITKSRVIVTPTMALSERGSDLAIQQDILKRIVDGGGRIVAGTDSPFVGHADSLHRELEIYVGAGLTVAQALRSSQSDAAEALGAGSQLGRIAPGYMADLVVLNANPFDDIGNVRDIHTVMKNGEVACLNPQ